MAVQIVPLFETGCPNPTQHNSFHSSFSSSADAICESFTQFLPRDKIRKIEDPNEPKGKLLPAVSGIKPYTRSLSFVYLDRTFAAVFLFFLLSCLLVFLSLLLCLTRLKGGGLMGCIGG